LEKSFFYSLLWGSIGCVAVFEAKPVGTIGFSTGLPPSPSFSLPDFPITLLHMERVKFTLEFIFKASPAIVYKFFTTPSCLVRWFCDEVDIQGETYTFSWSGSEEEAELIEDIENEKLRFRWEEAEDEEYLEFDISKSPVTGETILVITDFCDDDEVDDQKQLWHSQMEDLRKEMGG
jgi:uncharacterized protein YndB with AHSA1/START domain